MRKKTGLQWHSKNSVFCGFLFQIEIEDSGLNVTGNSLSFDRLYNLRKLSLDTVTFRGIELIYTDRKFDFEHKSVNCNHNGIDNDCQIGLSDACQDEFWSCRGETATLNAVRSFKRFS